MLTLDRAKFLRGRLFVLAFLIGTLSCTITLKLGEIQYLELILAADSLFVLGLFVHNQLRVKVFKPFLSLGFSYLIFLGLALALSFAVLGYTSNPYHFNFLKQPVMVTISRMVELSLDVFYMLYMASVYREDEALCRFGAKTYYWTGIAGGLYAIACFPLNYFYDAQLGTYLVNHRMRGFNNEAGSYGTYLVSVILLAVAMYRRRWLSKRQFYSGMALLLICWAGAQSKGGFFVAVTISVLQMIWMQNGVRRLASVLALGVVFTAVALLVDIPGQISAYARDSARYDKYSNIKSADPNYVVGRVAGTVLAPRMMAEHPWTGIGWGNYPLVRDDPRYRHGGAFILGTLDSPSLGPIDYIVELGWPLWIYMTWVALKPVYFLRRRRADPWLMSLAMMQPVANWFGAHLNITYPWVVVGLALGMGFRAANPGDETAPAEARV
jgi:hypothetical protein